MVGAQRSRAPTRGIRPSPFLIAEWLRRAASRARQEVARDFEHVPESDRRWPYATALATDHEHLRAIAFWRDLLARVADDMDATAAREEDARRRRRFETRSRRIRELLAEPAAGLVGDDEHDRAHVSRNLGWASRLPQDVVERRELLHLPRAGVAQVIVGVQVVLEQVILKGIDRLADEERDEILVHD